MPDWQDDLEYDLLTRWPEAAPKHQLPEPLWAALRLSLGRDFTATLVHPATDEGDDIVFLVIGDEDVAFLVRFEPPSTTTISFLGSLAGGEYTETVTFVDIGQEIVGFFNHERLGDNPLRVTLRPEGNPRARQREGPRRALERTEALLTRLRSWSAQPKP